MFEASPPREESEIPEKLRIKHSLFFPLFFLLVIWVVWASEQILGNTWHYLGVYPRSFEGLIGVITAPLVHGDAGHLANNSLSFVVLAVALFYFYRGVSYRVFFLNYITVGILVWMLARPSYHIGASGLIYGLASFLFFSGIMKRIIPLIAISLMVAFWYGGMVWYVFPVEPGISWESHLMGAVSGLIWALVYRKLGPQPRIIEWDDENDHDESDDWQNSQSNETDNQSNRGWFNSDIDHTLNK